MKHGFKRLISLVLTLCMVLSILPMGQVSAADVPYTVSVGGTGCTVSDLGVSETADVVYTTVSNQTVTAEPEVTWTVNGNILEGSLKGATTDPTRGSTHYRLGGTSTITLTNNKSVDAELSFAYSVSLVNTSGSKYDSVLLNGEEIKTSGTGNVTVTLAAGATYTITLSVGQKSKTGSDPDSGASIAISDLKLVGQGKVDLVFDDAVNGTYTITELDATGNETGTVIEPGSTLNTVTTNYYTLEATPDAGYAFSGWYFVDEGGNGGYLSADQSYTLQFGEGGTVYPVFIDEADGIFGVGESLFDDLNEAAEAALGSTEKVVVLLKDAELSGGEYTVPYGVTLLIPYDDAAALNLENPTSVILNNDPWVQPTAFRSLTLSDGAVLTVYGNLSVNARHIACQGGKNNGGAVYHTYGEIIMDSTAEVVIGNAGVLYAWGYVWGEGTVTAEAGATIYEKMQVTDYRGGSNTSTIALRNGEGKTDGAFPFNQYYVQNVEVKEILEPGAKLKAHASIFVSGEEPVGAAVDFISQSGAMFTTNGATVTKRYDPETDRLIIDVDDGQVALNGISLTMEAFGTIDSANFTLPINGNITINLNNGEATIDQELVLQPGTEINLGFDAFLANNANIYVMDVDQWGAYVFSEKTCAPIPYSPSLGGASTRGIDSDAVIDVNGYMVVIGGLYTTKGGAKIISSEGTGFIEYAEDADYDGDVVYQIVGGSDLEKIPVVSMLLTNGVEDPKFTETATTVAGDGYSYDAEYDMWLKNSSTEFSVAWIDGDGNEIYNDNLEVKSQVVYDEETYGIPTKTNTDEITYTFIGWNTDPEATEALDTLPAMNNDVVYYAIFEAETNTYQVVWMDADGETALDIEEYAYGETPEFKQEISGPSNCYTLSWSPEIVAVTGPATYTAVWTANHNPGDAEMENETDATCTEDGGYDEVVYCQDCNEELSRTHHTTKATGHGTVLGFEYNPMGDGTHEVFCLDCEYPVDVVPCTEFENYLCVDCGDAQRHTITFMNGGEEWYSTTCAHGDTLGIAGMPVPTMDGYEFAGWYTEGGEHIYHGITVNGDIVAYATWNPIVALPGSFNDWDTSVKMTKGEDGLYTYQMQLDKGTYQFKVMDAGVWLGNNGTISDTTNGYEWTFSKNEAYNCTLAASGGTYTFTYNPETKGLKVEAELDHTHVYGEPTFTWDHYYTSCVATAVCECNDEQTVNMTITAANEDGMLVFTASGTLNGETVTDECTVYAADTNAIYFDNSIAKWSVVYAYNWNSANYSKTAAWPGVRMTQVEGVDDLYVVIVPDGYDMMIFNNGSVQSSDQTMPTDGCNTAVWYASNNVRWGYNKPAQHTISFVVDGETRWSLGGFHYGHKVDYEDLDSVVTKPEKEGYTFAGYDYSNAPEYVTGDITITGSFTAKEYKIKLDFNGGMDIDGETEYEQTFTVTSFDSVSNVLFFNGEDIFRDGYTFAGWSTVKDDASTKIDIDTWLPTEEETVLYALWEANTYTVTWMVDGEVYTTTDVTYGEAITAPATEPVKEGHIFAGWQDVPATMPAENITITGSFTAKEYKIKLDFNGGMDDRGSTESEYTFTVATFENVSIVLLTQGEDIFRDGYTFAGWSTVKDDASTKIDIDTWLPTEEETDLYALWEPKLYVLNLDFNGGANLNGDSFMTWRIVYGDWEAMRFEIEFYSNEGKTVRDGYTFAGWTTVKDDETTKIDIDTWVPTEEETTLFTLWEANTYTVTWMVDGEVYTTTDVTYGEAITAPATEPVKEGHSFAGWQDVPATMPAENITITGSFTANTYTVTWKLGSETYTTSVTYGDAIENPDVTVPDNYFSYRWTSQIPETMPADDITIEGVWTVSLSVLDEEGNEMQFASGGLSYYPQWKVVDLGDTAYANYRGTNYMEGHTLWLVNTEDETERYEITYSSGSTVYPSVPMDQNKTLQLVAVPKVYTVTYDLNGGTLDEETKQMLINDGFAVTDTSIAHQVEYGYNYGVGLSGLTKTGYHITGVVDQDGTFIAEQESFIVTGDTTLTVQWEANEYTLALLAFQPSGDTTFAGCRVEIQVPYGAVLADYIPESAETDRGTAVILMPGDTAEVSGRYFEGTFTITGWYNCDTSDMVDVTTATMPAEDLEIQNDFTFTGWAHDYYDYEQGGMTDTRQGTAYWVDRVPQQGWQQIDGEWYYFADAGYGRYFRAEGLSRAPYPTDKINGNTYAPDQETLDYCAGKGIEFIDAEEAWFLFDEDGKFQHDYTDLAYHEDAKSASWAVNGMLTWHPGMIDVDHVGIGYFIGDTEKGGNYAVGGFVNVTRTNDLASETGTYYFDPESYGLCEYTGITEIDGTLYYFTEGYRLAEGAGLIRMSTEQPSTYNVVLESVGSSKLNVIKVVMEYTGLSLKDSKDLVESAPCAVLENVSMETAEALVSVLEDVGATASISENRNYEYSYYYVRSDGKLVVGTTYWVANVNEYTEIAVGEYEFDETGKMIIPEADPVKDGIYQEDDGWYYYQDGVLAYGLGLVEVTEVWHASEGDAEMTEIIYVRSNGSLAQGTYYVTNVDNYTGSLDIPSGTKLIFGNDGTLVYYNHGIVAENNSLYYYQYNELVYGAGLIQIDGNYYYVRSNGEVVHDRYYWITNTNDTGVAAKNYYFDSEGVLQNPEMVADQRNGIVEVDGVLYYYENGTPAYGAGLVVLEEGVIYVRSNGALAIGKYWVTNTAGTGYPQGYYTFGQDGFMVM